MRSVIWGELRLMGLLAVAGLAVSACGGDAIDGDDVAIQGDHSQASPNDAFGSVQAVQNNPFELVSMTPAPDSQVATPLSPIDLVFSRAVDPESVGGIVLRERESARIVPTSIAVNGVHVTVTPLRPLDNNYRYNLEVTQIQAQAPPQMPHDFTKRFFTDPNFPTLYIRYKNGEATRSHEYDWDPVAGDLRIDHFLRGPDNVLQTEDDLQDKWVLVHYDALADNTYTNVRAQAGPDGIYGTLDDEQIYQRIMQYGAPGRLVRDYVMFGDDMTPGTIDDSVIHETRYYDSEDLYLGECNGSQCTQRIHQPGEILELTLTDPGPDGIWRTADDVLGTDWTRHLVDNVGVVTGMETHVLAGDGTPTPSAATMTGYTAITLVNQQPTQLHIYDAPGADAVWNTADDEGVLVVDITYDAGGLRLDRQDHKPGPDGLLGTADDELAAQWTY